VRSPMSELAKRVLVGVVAAPLAIAAVFAGGAALAALLAIVAALGAWEFYRIARASGHRPFGGAGIVLAGVAPLVVHAHFLNIGTLPPAALVIAALVVAAASIWRRGPTGAPLGAVAITLFGVLYVGVTLGFGYALRYQRFVVGFDGAPGIGEVSFAGSTFQLSLGGLLLLLPLLVTWASDIGGYFVGRALGRHKLIPSVSPGKTVEGSLGAMIFSVAVAWLVVQFLMRPVGQLGLTTTGTILFGVAVSAAAQVGDLFESLIKREAGVKDSSHLIPGHGGVLDRVDSLFFVLPVAYLLLDSMLVYAPR